MIVLLDPARPSGSWNMPDEFVNPTWFASSSPSAQEILESRGLQGLQPDRLQSCGARMVRLAGYGAPWDRLANRLRLG